MKLESTWAAERDKAERQQKCTVCCACRLHSKAATIGILAVSWAHFQIVLEICLLLELASLSCCGKRVSDICFQLK